MHLEVHLSNVNFSHIYFSRMNDIIQMDYFSQ